MICVIPVDVRHALLEQTVTRSRVVGIAQLGELFRHGKVEPCVAVHKGLCDMVVLVVVVGVSARNVIGHRCGPGDLPVDLDSRIAGESQRPNGECAALQSRTGVEWNEPQAASGRECDEQCGKRGHEQHLRPVPAERYACVGVKPHNRYEGIGCLLNPQAHRVVTIRLRMPGFGILVGQVGGARGIDGNGLHAASVKPHMHKLAVELVTLDLGHGRSGEGNVIQRGHEHLRVG